VRDQYEAAIKAYNDANNAYRDDQNRLHGLFQTELEAEMKMTDHPKAGKLWAFAYDRGHANGIGEVYNEYVVALDLVK
jgi:hypothetical protein